MNKEKIRDLGEKVEAITQHSMEMKAINGKIQRILGASLKVAEYHDRAHDSKEARPEHLREEYELLKNHHKRSKYWYEIVEKINKLQNKEDVALAAANRLYEVGMNIVENGHVPALIYFLDNALIKEDPYDLPEDLQNIESKLDDIKSINEMACRIIFYVTNNMITFKTAEKLTSLLERKVSLLETGVILKDLQKLKEFAYGGGIPAAQNRVEGLPTHPLRPAAIPQKIEKRKAGRPSKKNKT